MINDKFYYNSWQGKTNMVWLVKALSLYQWYKWKHWYKVAPNHQYNFKVAKH